jgi:hypothetical protein
MSVPGKTALWPGVGKQRLVKHRAFFTVSLLQKSKAIFATGRGGQQGCKTLRIPHFLDNRLTDGGEVVSLTRWQRFTQQEDS